MHPQNIGNIRVPMAYAVSCLFDNHSRCVREVIDKCDENGRAGWGRCFFFYGSTSGWMAVQDFDSGWCWYRDDAVRTCDKAAAQFYGRTPDSIDFQEVKTDGRAHNIYNGVSCTDFVEMDFIHILVVNSGFGFSQTTEYGKAGCLDRFFERTRGYDCFDVFKISVFMQVLFENYLDTGAVDALAGIVNYFEGKFVIKAKP